MSHTTIGAVLRQIRQLVRPHNEAPPEDGDLLNRFALQRDEAAFGELVRRHGALVLSVCRRVLGNADDADDAFQATFLVFARKARSISKPGSLSSWLHGAAYRIALKLRTRGQRSAPQEPPDDHSRQDPAGDLAWREVRAILDEELQRLPEKYRAPLVLCYLEGLTQDEASGRLGLSASTLRGRVDRGRERLRRQLVHRGIGLPAGLFVAALAPAAVPAALLERTVQGGLLFAAGEVPAGPLTVPATLAAEVLRGALLAKWKMLLSWLLLLSILAVATGAIFQRPTGAQPGAAVNSAALGVAPPAAVPLPKSVALDRHGDPLPEHALARLGTVRLRLDAGIEAVAYLPDGQLLAILSERDRSLRLWEAATGKEVKQTKLSWKSYVSPQFSADRKLLAVGVGPDKIGLVDVTTGKAVRELSGHVVGTTVLAFSSDGQTLAAAGQGNTIHRWEIASGKELSRLEENPAPPADPKLAGHPSITALVFSPDGKVIATGGADGKIRTWDVTEGKQARQFDAHANGVRSLAYHKDGRSLASCGTDGAVRLWDLATGKRLCQFEPTLTEQEKRLGGRIGRAEVIHLVGFSPDGATLISADWGGHVCLWDVASGKELPKLANDPDHARHHRRFTCSPDGKTLLTVSDGGALRFWDLTTRTERLPLPTHRSGILGLAFSPDGKYIASGSFDRVLCLWEADTGKVLHQFATRPEGFLSLAFSPDGKQLASGGLHSGREPAVCLWDVATGQLIHRLGAVGKTLSGPVAYSPDGRLLATVGSLKTAVVLWDPATGKEVRQMSADLSSLPRAVVFSADGKTVATGSLDGVRLWDVATGRQVGQVGGDPKGCTCTSFTPDMRSAAAFNGGQHFLVWNLDSAAKPRQVGTLKSQSMSLAISPDGKSLVSGGDGTTVSLWEIATGQERRRFLGFQRSVGAVTFSRDGRRVAAGSWDTTALIWDATGLAPGGVLPAQRLSEAELKSLWTDLAGDDGMRAYGALWSLVAGAKQAVPYLRERLQPAVAIDPKQMEHWIADLEHKDFMTRQKAAAALEGLDEPVAGPALRKALAGKPTLETQRRLEDILEKLVAQVPSAEVLPALRAIEVLEQVGTTEARAILQTLAQGAPPARLTREAKASLDRLARRPAGTP